MKMYFKNQFRQSFLVFMTVALALALTSCMDDENDIEAPETAFVSLYHASPNSSGLDILVDNRQINSYPLKYSDNTGYLRFYTGERQLKFTPFDANNSVIDTTAVFENGSAYSVFISGVYPIVKTLIVKDDAEGPAEGKAKVRLVHLSPDGDPVSLFGSDENTLVESQSYFSASEFTDIDAKTYNFDIKDDSGETLLNVDDINLSSGIYYTIVIKGFSNPPQGNDNYFSAEILVN